jgi:hypothetical protein
LAWRLLMAGRARLWGGTGAGAAGTSRLLPAAAPPAADEGAAAPPPPACCCPTWETPAPAVAVPTSSCSSCPAGLAGSSSLAAWRLAKAGCLSWPAANAAAGRCLPAGCSAAARAAAGPGARPA